MATVLKFSNDGQTYTLEYTRDSAIKVGAMGFSPVKYADNIPLYRELLFHGAFLAHHKHIKKDLTKDMLYSLPNEESRDNLIETLMEMFAASINSLNDSGNATWEVVSEGKVKKD